MFESLAFWLTASAAIDPYFRFTSAKWPGEQEATL